MNSLVKHGETRNTGHKWAKGESGNPSGRPPKPEIELLRDALECAKQEKGTHLIKHAVYKAYRDNNVLIAILKKILPDKIKGEGFDSRHITQIYSGLTAGDLRGLITRLAERVSA